MDMEPVGKHRCRIEEGMLLEVSYSRQVPSKSWVGGGTCGVGGEAMDPGIPFLEAVLGPTKLHDKVRLAACPAYN